METWKLKHKVIKILWKYKYQKQSWQKWLWWLTSGWGGVGLGPVLALVDNPGGRVGGEEGGSWGCVVVWSGAALCCRGCGGSGWKKTHNHCQQITSIRPGICSGWFRAGWNIWMCCRLKESCAPVFIMKLLWGKKTKRRCPWRRLPVWSESNIWDTEAMWSRQGTHDCEQNISRPMDNVHFTAYYSIKNLKNLKTWCCEN